MKDFFEKLLHKGKKKTALLWFVGLVSFLVLSFIVVLSRNGLPSVSDTDASVESFSAAGLFLDVMLKLGIILLLIYGLFRLAKFFQQGETVRENSQLKVLESVRLSPQQSIHLIQVSDFCLLIGATDQTLTRLSEVDLPPEVIDAYQPAGSGQDFSNMFQKMIQDRFQQPGEG